jgi:hypothetical protein
MVSNGDLFSTSCLLCRPSLRLISSERYYYYSTAGIDQSERSAREGGNAKQERAT